MLGNKAKPRRLNSKGNLYGNNSSISNSNSNTLLSLSPRSLHLDTVASRLGKALSNSIPVLSIFALVGIIGFSLSPNSPHFNLAPISTCSAKCDPGINDVCPAGSTWSVSQCQCILDGASSSLTIDNNTVKDNITAVRNDIAYASHNIKLNASDIASYTLTITGPTNLTTTDSNGNTVSSGTTITGAGNKTPANMSNNTWGYGWGSASANEANLSYQSFTGSAQTLASGNADSNHNASLENKLVFAAKFSDNATEGHYKATVGLNLTVTPRALSSLEQNLYWLQDMTPEICNAATTGEQATLKDRRDGNDYTIAKLSDGSCWMTQNLRIVNKTISSTDSDMTSGSFTIPASSTSGFSSDTVSNAYYSGDTAYGSYYTWCAATAGTCSSATSANVDASASICPKGWKLPKNGEYGTLNTKYSGAWTTDGGKNGRWFGAASTSAGGAFFPAAGYYVSSSPSNVGSYGYYWSRTARNSTNAYRLYFHSSTVNPADYSTRRNGYSVRCVAEKPQEYTYSISYKFKDGHSLHSGTMPSNETITTTNTSHTFTVKSGPMVQVGVGSWCSLKNWLGSDGVVYTPNSTVTLTPDQPSITLTTNATGTCAGA